MPTIAEQKGLLVIAWSMSATTVKSKEARIVTYAAALGIGQGPDVEGAGVAGTLTVTTQTYDAN